MSRQPEVAAKLARVRGWLDEAGHGAALFSSQPAVAWVTGGLEDRVVRDEEPALVWALITADEAWLVTTNIEQPRILAEEDTGGFAVHAVPWHRPGGLAGAVEDLPGGQKAVEPPASLRMPLTTFEAERMALLGSDTAHALEGAMRSWQPAERECDLGAGFDGEWREHVQGGPIGYLSREFDVVPGTPAAAGIVAAGTAFAWNPTVRGAKSEDTFVAGPDGPVPVTNTTDWPVLAAGRPAILPV